MAISTIDDVAREAGVSKATVSRVIAGRSSVNPDLAERVRSAMQALNFHPNVVAQTLATRRSRTIGMVVNDFYGPYYGLMMTGVENECDAHGYQMMVASGHAQAERESAAVSLLLQRQCEAVILHADGLRDDALEELAHRTEDRIVIINRLVPALAENCIYTDDRTGGALAARHLLDHGHRKVACITGPLRLHEARERLEGFCTTMAEAGVAPGDDMIIEGDFTERGGSRAVSTLLDRPPGQRPTALFCQNDQMAAGAMMLCRERALTLPHELSIVGFDDIEFAQFLYPRLTTVRQPLDAMGRVAVRHILAKTGLVPRAPASLVFQPFLIVRDSVARIS
jgi:LacI family transcriptional regulator